MPELRPTLWLLASRREGGRSAPSPGACRATRLGGDLGSSRPTGAAGSGGPPAALLGHVLASGLRRVVLSVDAENPTGATALYERMGMRVVSRWDVWERSPRGSAGG